jgi:raffinose/stachyose/melibiose transport system substrate-binding protein
MGDGYEAQSYPDSQNMFTLGRAAIYPAGSWEIAGFNAQADFEMGAFKVPVQAAGDECYISDHVDIALGMNKATKNPEAARTFLNWVGSAEFADLYANSLPGFFSLSDHNVNMTDPLAQDFVSWRGECNSSIRPYHQILSRGTPNLANEYWVTSANVIRGSMTPEEAAAHMQKGLASWYAPQQ